MHNIELQIRRSVLFVPGARAERFGKAAGSGADLFCIDLEDAVPGNQKDGAREAALAFFAGDGAGDGLAGDGAGGGARGGGADESAGGRGALRINSLNTADGLRDILALREAERLPGAVLLPKVRCRGEARLARELLGARCEGVALFALLESSEGIANAAAIAAEPGVDCLLFGSADWSAETGADMGWDSLLTPRSMVLQAAAQAGIDAIDGAWLDLEDADGLREETARIARMGFAGKVLLHPKQVEPAHEGFRPPAEAVARAKAVIKAFNAGGGATVVDGRMVDAPVYRAALRTLAAAP